MKKISLFDGVPAILRGGPADGRVMQIPGLVPIIKIPVQPDFLDSIKTVKAVDPQKVEFKVAIYERTDESDTLQLPPPAPPNARRVGFEYQYRGEE